MRGAIGLWHDEIKGVAYRLLGTVSEERLCPPVPQADHPDTIRKDDGVRSMRNQCCF